MVTHYVWAAIAGALFVAGVGIGYAILASTYGPGNFMFQNQQQMLQQMRQNPQLS